MNEELLSDVKILLGFDPDDTELNSKLNFILDSAKSRLKLLLGGIEPPEELRHIIVEVAVIRFNRIGSEGLGSHTVEGESLSYNDNDFSGFMDEINAYLDAKNKNAKRGGFKFL